LQWMVLSLVPQCSSIELQDSGCVLQSSRHGPPLHVMTMPAQAESPVHTTLQSCSDGHSTRTSRQEDGPEHSTRQGRSSGHTNMSIAQLLAPVQSNRHTPSASHCEQTSSQPPPGGSTDAPQASVVPVVLLEPSELLLLELDPAEAVVPVPLATAVVESPVLVVETPVLVAGSPLELESSAEPCPYTSRRQPNRNGTTIASLRTRRS
jgi:hypothetical protein